MFMANASSQPIKVLITCPPMLRAIETFRAEFGRRGAELTTPKVTQTLTEEELVALVPQFDAWIIGDDPATARVFSAGRSGRLRAAVKWGVGVDNVDLQGAQALGIHVSNTPGMFGLEVADVAMGYLITLSRQLHVVDAGVKAGAWPKPAGQSLAGKTAALVGFGDIGRSIAKRLLASDVKVIAYDPQYRPAAGCEAVESAQWPDRLAEANYLILACALNGSTRHIVNANSLAAASPGLSLINVSRGPLVDEEALADAMARNHVSSAALEVSEIEPRPLDSRLRAFGNRVLFGSHNGSNTREAVERTSWRAIDLLFAQL